MLYKYILIMHNYIDIEKNLEGYTPNLIVAILGIWNWGKAFNFYFDDDGDFSVHHYSVSIFYSEHILIL